MWIFKLYEMTPLNQFCIAFLFILLVIVILIEGSTMD